MSMRVCSQSGCPVISPEPRCPQHRHEYEQRRGTRQQRGYTSDHDRARAQWAPRVTAGLVDCHATICLEPSRRIAPTALWDLGHTEDRTSWTGPEHARCNRSAGGKAAHR